MSTTKNPAVALDYSGGAAAKGSIFCIDFDMSSRGAAVQWLSQYPHEEARARVSAPATLLASPMPLPP